MGGVSVGASVGVGWGRLGSVGVGLKRVDGGSDMNITLHTLYIHTQRVRIMTRTHRGTALSPSASTNPSSLMPFSG